MTETEGRTMAHHTPDHEHTVRLEHALEFVNTGDPVVGAPRERLADPDAAVAWLVGAGAIHPTAVVRPSQAQAARIRGARAALRGLLDANAEHRLPGQEDLALVQSLLSVRPEPTLAADDHGLAMGHRHTDDPVGEALAAMATPIVEELARGRAERLRVCGNPTCRWTFFDTSPSGRRRWCEMQSCGNRAKAARHRARVKAARAAGEPLSATEERARA